MAEQQQEIQIQLQPSFPPPPASYATFCLINKLGQTVFFDFGYLDPLIMGSTQPGTPVRATHVQRMVMAEDAALKLRDDLNRILGGGS